MLQVVTNLYKFYDKWLIPLIFAFFVILHPKPVNALADSLGYARAYQVTCNSTAAALCRTGYCSFQAFKFWINSATAVYIGGSDVDTSTKGMPYCNTTSCLADADSIDGSPNSFYCKSAGSVTVTVIAGRK